MTNSDLIKKLNNLGDIQPDKKWLNSNRDLLLSQLANTGAEPLSFWKAIAINLGSFSRMVSKPAYALGLFVILLLGGALVSQRALIAVKPNDSLYIARIIAEQVKLNTTFNAQSRNRLAASYAVSHAQDINSMLANPDFNNPDNSAQVAKLSTSFNQEVQTVKNRIGSLNTNVNDTSVAKITVTKNQSVSTSPKEADFVIADNARNNQGISLLVSSSSSKKTIVADRQAGPVSNSLATVAASTSKTLASSSASSTATSTETTSTSTDQSLIASSTPSADQIIDEAQQLFNSKDYNQAGLKLDEASTLINKEQ